MSESRKPVDRYTGNDAIDLYYEDNGRRIEEVYWRDPSTLGDTDLLFFALFHIDAEVRNGGLAQAVTNHGGELLPFARACLDRIGVPEAALILAEIAGRMPHDLDWSDQDEREEAFYEAFDDDEVDDEFLEALDQRWAALQDELYDALARHLDRATAVGLPN